MIDYRLSERLAAVRAQLAKIARDAQLNKEQLRDWHGNGSMAHTLNSACLEIEMGQVDLASAESLFRTFESARFGKWFSDITPGEIKSENPPRTLFCGRPATEADWWKLYGELLQRYTRRQFNRFAKMFPPVENVGTATAGSGLDASGEGDADGKN